MSRYNQKDSRTGRDTRVFNGKRYLYQEYYTSKSVAMDIAKRLRGDGLLIRITQGRNPFSKKVYYTLWYRNKK